MRTSGVAASSVTGAMSVAGLNGIDGRRFRLMLKGPAGATKRACPSAGARSTLATPRSPLAPGLFSTTKGWPCFFVRSCARMRASRSTEPPGGLVATMRTGPLGHPRSSAAGAGGARRALSEPVGARKPFFPEKRRIEKLRLVARARVGEDRDHRVAGAEVAREADRAGDVDGARAPEAQSFAFQQRKDQGKSFGVGDLVGVVDGRAFDVLRDAPLADALGDGASARFQPAVLEPAVHRRAERVGDRDPDVPVFLFQEHRNTGQRSPGADGAGEAVDLAARLGPDLRAGAQDVALAVRGVVPLVRPEGAQFFG